MDFPLPDFTIMTTEEKKAYRQKLEAKLARDNQLATMNVNCPYCHATAGRPCRSDKDYEKKITIHRARKHAWRDAGRPGNDA